MKRFLYTVFLIIFSINLYSQSQNVTQKSFEAIRINSEEIKLDGKLDEPFWNSIIGIKDFLSLHPKIRKKKNKKIIE